MQISTDQAKETSQAFNRTSLFKWQLFNNQLFKGNKMLADKSYHQSQMLNSIASNLSKDQDVNTGKWTNEQNLKYAIFMDFHKVTLSSRQKKKNFRVFQEMAKFLASRNTVQCRSHHQKLQERYKHFKKIISAVKNQVGRKEYKLLFKKWTNSGSELVCSEPNKKQKNQNCQQQQQQELKKQENIVIKPEQKAQQMSFTPTMIPYYSYPSFQSAFAYSMPNFYPFGTQYFC